MDADLKAKWLTALRSGEYKQHRLGLHSGGEKPEGFCCLGVLWDIAGRPDGPLSNYWRDTIGNEAKGTLIVMNDDEKKSFAEIADYIERTL